MSIYLAIGFIFIYVIIYLSYEFYLKKLYIEEIKVLDKYEYGYDGGYIIKYEVNTAITTAYLYNDGIFETFEKGEEYKVRMRRFNNKVVIVSIVKE